MHLKQSLKLILPIIILTTGGSAIASAAKNGPYIEGNIGTLYASVNFFGIQLSQFGSFGINANGGYQFNTHWATEMGYTNYGLGLNNIDAAVKYIMSIGDDDSRFSLFGKIGPAFVFDNHGSSSLLPFAGLGAAYSINNNLDATIQAQGITVGFFSLGLVSTGLTYHFN